MQNRGWPDSMLREIADTRVRNFKPARVARKSAISRLSYVDSIKLERYRAWLSSRLRLTAAPR